MARNNDGIDYSEEAQLGNMTLSIAVVTPEWAKAILDDQNIGNRSPKRLQQERITNDIRNGEWLTETAEFLKFDTEGTLIDGQNRLEAVVMSRQNVTMLIAEGLPTKAREVIDQGVKRSGADVLGWHDAELPTGCSKSILGATLRILGAWTGDDQGRYLVKSNQKSSRFNISVTDLVKLYDAHNGDSVEAVQFATSVPRLVRYSIPTSTIAAAYYLTKKADSVAAERFWHGWANQAHDQKSDPRLAMNAMFHDVHENTWDSKVTGIYLYGFFEAWNAWREQRPVKEMSYREGTGKISKKTKVQEFEYKDIPTPK